uniref:Uncharacterized protein n=1 Tax=Arundo donax TaxID=35708 RepID=A0A0A8YPW2_ARUDO
MLCNYIYS